VRVVPGVLPIDRCRGGRETHAGLGRFREHHSALLASFITETPHQGYRPKVDIQHGPNTVNTVQQ
jgi:hypothetical protein